VLHVRGARDSEELRGRVRRMFQLHLDLLDFYRLTNRYRKYLAYWCKLWEEVATGLQQAQAGEGK